MGWVTLKKIPLMAINSIRVSSLIQIRKDLQKKQLEKGWDKGPPLP